MKKYIVCDACYMVDSEDYDKILMPIWFPENHPISVNNFQSYGGDFTLKSLFNRPVNFVQYMSTNAGDCVVDWLGCDAGNFSLFEIDCDEETLIQFNAKRHMFRVFEDRDDARSYLEKIISKS